jgi:hypothetical protein
MSKTILKGEANRATSTDVSVADPNATVVLTAEQGCESACPSNQQPTDAREEAIRALAHSKWEAAGCPAGDGFDFWLEAEREVNAKRSGSSPDQG